MTSRTSVEDVESNTEADRIKQTYRNSVIQTEAHATIAPNVPEVQAALREMNTDLELFLKDHLNKVKNLQAFVLAPQDSLSMTHESHATVIPVDRRPSLHPPEITFPAPVIDRTSSYDGGITPVPEQRSPLRRSIMVSKPVNLDVHIVAIQTFLKSHIENIQELQNSLHRHSDTKTNAPSTVYHRQLTKSSFPETITPSQVRDFNREFTILVVTSTFSAILIIAFLSMVHLVIGSTRKIAFNIGMLFSFLALLMHFGNIVIAGRGYLASTVIHSEKERDVYYFKLKIWIWQQLQFAATVLFILSTFVMTFLIFISVAFPVVLIILSLIEALVVFFSMYWEVAVNLDNILYLIKNIQRARQSLEYLKIRGRAIAKKE